MEDKPLESPVPEAPRKIPAPDLSRRGLLQKLREAAHERVPGEHRAGCAWHRAATHCIETAAHVAFVRSLFAALEFGFGGGQGKEIGRAHV